ncbi:hypothetical protein ICE98_02999 [Lactococcus lactis]|nr:hypothetical protein [Lactococcus lactis]
MANKKPLQANGGSNGKVVRITEKTIKEHSVEWYKKQLLKDFSVQFIKDSLLPQLFEWSNAYKAAAELTK